jgi:hypothetical protein
MKRVAALAWTVLKAVALSVPPTPESSELCGDVAER